MTEACIRFLEKVAADRSILAGMTKETCTRLLTAAGRVAFPDPQSKRDLRRALKRESKIQERQRDEAVLARTEIRRQQTDPVFQTPQPAFPPKPGLIENSTALVASDADRGTHAIAGRVSAGRSCYVCKSEYRDIHFFYDALCPRCAEFNYEKRNSTADLSGRVALVTGARIKIGYQAAIKLLRAGARVIVTTRFPHDAAKRYAVEADFSDWQDRLEIHGLDLRISPHVEQFADEVSARHERLDFLLNNACQTVRKPPGFYEHLMEDEHRSLESLPQAEADLLQHDARLRKHAARGATTGGLSQQTSGHLAASDAPSSAALSQIPLTAEDQLAVPDWFPAGKLDQDLQQVDLREMNSWRLGLAEVSTVEFLEVQLVNAVAPFLLNARLKPLMLKTANRDKHIVNVSAMEGQFYRAFKTEKHPHTNMAKAALNMMTRTSAIEYQRDGIHMNSVDTGWITDEDPACFSEQKSEQQGRAFHPPLDIVDAAARICDPFLSGINSGEHIWGQFLKDYRPVDW